MVMAGYRGLHLAPEWQGATYASLGSIAAYSFTGNSTTGAPWQLKCAQRRGSLSVHHTEVETMKSEMGKTCSTNG